MGRQKRPSRSKARRSLYGIRAVDSMTERVLGFERQRRKRKQDGSPENLRDRASRASDPAERRRLLRMADQVERDARERSDARLVSKKAEERARRALERARWERER